MVRRIRNVATAVVGVVAAATALSTAVGTLMGQAPAQNFSVPPAPGNGSVMVQTHKRAQPQVPELERAEDPNFNEAQGPGQLRSALVQVVMCFLRQPISERK